MPKRNESDAVTFSFRLESTLKKEVERIAELGDVKPVDVMRICLRHGLPIVETSFTALRQHFQNLHPVTGRVRYATRVIESLAALWPTTREDDQQFRDHLGLLVSMATTKLNRVWKVEAEDTPHRNICAKVFWNRVATQYPGHGVESVHAIWDETVNPPQRKADYVHLYIQPAAVAEKLKIVLELPVASK